MCGIFQVFVTWWYQLRQSCFIYPLFLSSFSKVFERKSQAFCYFTQHILRYSCPDNRGFSKPIAAMLFSYFIKWAVPLYHLIPSSWWHFPDCLQEGLFEWGSKIYPWHLVVFTSLTRTHPPLPFVIALLNYVGHLCCGMSYSSDLAAFLCHLNCSLWLTFPVLWELKLEVHSYCIQVFLYRPHCCCPSARRSRKSVVTR